jgi:hypothetical protein
MNKKLPGLARIRGFGKKVQNKAPGWHHETEASL